MLGVTEVLLYLDYNDLGPVVQSIFCITSLLVVKMLIVLVSTISNAQVFLLKKCGKCKSYSHFFSKIICVYAIFNDKSFNDTLTNNIVSFTTGSHYENTPIQIY